MRKLGVGATVLAGLLLTASAFAAVGATLVLTNGQRVRADIFDMNAQGVVGRVNGSAAIVEHRRDCRDRLRGRRQQLPRQRTRPRGLGAAGPARRVARVRASRGHRRQQPAAHHVLGPRLLVQRRRAHLLLASGGGDVVAGPAGCPGWAGPSVFRPTADGCRRASRCSRAQPVLLVTTGEVRLSADPNDIATPAGSKIGRYDGAVAAPELERRRPDRPCRQWPSVRHRRPEVVPGPCDGPALSDGQRRRQRTTIRASSG